MTTDVVPGMEPILPEPDELTAFFWEGARHGQLRIQRCQACGCYVHPPKPVCPACLSFHLEPETVSGRGRVYSYTVGVQAFHPWFESRLPYLLAVVELDEQPNLKLVTNLVDCTEDDVRIGMPVMVVFEEISPQISLPMFAPAGGM
jgi:uncharacterized protein